MKTLHQSVPSDIPDRNHEDVPVGLYSDWSGECPYDVNMHTNPAKYYYL